MLLIIHLCFTLTPNNCLTLGLRQKSSSISQPKRSGVERKKTLTTKLHAYKFHMINTLEHLGPSGSDARWPTAILSRSEEAGVNRAICTTWSWPDLDLLTRSPRSGCQWVSLRVFIDWGAEAFCFEFARNRGTDEVQTRRVGSKMSARGIRRKKSSLSEVKVAVIGAPSVGKSGT